MFLLTNRYSNFNMKKGLVNKDLWAADAVLRSRAGSKPSKRLLVFITNQLYQLNKVNFYESGEVVRSEKATRT